MATIKEDYCSKEIYRLLIEKGFDGEIHTSFDKEGYTQASITLQMAMKWLREIHNLHIIVFNYDNSAFPYIWYIFAHNRDKPYEANSYEEACEAAIKYCLENLI